MKTKWPFILFITFIVSQRSMAFIESYSLFGPLETKVVNGPENIDGEYYSDLLAFRNRLKTDYNFLNASNAYDIYVGSVSSKQFAIQQRLKLKQSISSRLDFDLVYLEKENLEEGREQFMTGLTYKATKVLSLSAYTSLFSNKDQNDLGFAMNINLMPNHKLRFFLNRIDFGFNARNQLDATDQKSPMHYGFRGEWISSDFNFLEYYVFKNSPVIRDFSLTDQRYLFDELRGGLRGKLSMTPNYDYNFELDVFDGHEGQFAITTPDPTSDSNWSRTGVSFLNQIENGPYIIGLQYNYRYWASENGNVLHSNFSPHVWYNLRFNNNVFLPQSIDLGLESSIHNATGAKDLRSPSDSNSDVNSRFNLRMYFEFSPVAVLNLLLSADLDDGFSWEGGGGQFQILF